MPLMFPAEFKDIASDPKHPYYRPEATSAALAIFLDNEPTTDLDIVVASETNGYIKVLRKDMAGRYVVSTRHKNQIDTVVIKGKVQIFIRKEDAS